MLRPSAFSAFKTLLFALLLTPLSGFETHQATNQDQLFNLISYGGNSIMALGDEVIVAEGDYICGPCYGDGLMYFLRRRYGTVRCATDDLGCKLSGEGSRRVIYVDGTAGGIVVLRSFRIYRGKYSEGGGLSIPRQLPRAHRRHLDQQPRNDKRSRHHLRRPQHDLLLLLLRPLPHRHVALFRGAQGAARGQLPPLGTCEFRIYLTLCAVGGR